MTNAPSSTREALLHLLERRSHVLTQVRVTSVNALSALDKGTGLIEVALGEIALRQTNQ